MIIVAFFFYNRKLLLEQILNFVLNSNGIATLSIQQNLTGI